MDKNIKVHIKDRVAVAEGDPVIVCGNSDYTVTFTFDEEWGEAYAKTARFKFHTAEGPEHIDKPFTGDTVEVPELDNVREVEVGVFVGNLNTTTGAPIRCKPCVRCGSGAPKDPDPDVYDELMELINKGGGGTGGGGTLDGLPVYVVDTLPDDPEEGDIVALNTTVPRPWDKVKVWSRDELPYQEGNAVAICENLPLEGSFVASAAPEKFDLSEIDASVIFVSGVLLQGSNGHISLTMHTLTGLNGGIAITVQDHTDTYYHYNKGVWKAQQSDSNPIEISVQDIKLPSLSDVVAIDYTRLLTDDELMNYQSFASTQLWRALKILPQLGVLVHEPGLYIAEQSGGCVWQRVDKKMVKQVSSLTAQTTEATDNSLKALNKAEGAQSEATAARNQMESYAPKITAAEHKSTEAIEAASALNKAFINLQNIVDEAHVNATQAKSQAETNAGAIAELQEAVNGYSTFLEEINGEVVEDE